MRGRRRRSLRSRIDRYARSRSQTSLDELPAVHVQGLATSRANVVRHIDCLNRSKSNLRAARSRELTASPDEFVTVRVP